MVGGDDDDDDDYYGARAASSDASTQRRFAVETRTLIAHEGEIQLCLSGEAMVSRERRDDHHDDEAED